jgi:hypothetical protein
MPMGLLFGGILNVAIFGFPIWFWIAFLASLAIGISNFLWWWFFWLPLEPLHGHYFAYRKGVNSALVMDENINLKLVTEGQAKNIFNESVEEAKDLQRDWDEYPAGHIGTVHTDLIFDAKHWTSPKSRYSDIIESMAMEWNDHHEDDQIRTYGKLIKYIQDGKITPPPDFEYEITVPWNRIKSQYPDVRKPAVKDGYVRQMANKMEQQDKKQLSTNIPLMVLIFGGFLCAMMWVAKALHLIGTIPK